jgi:hypothetical protein
MSTLDAGLMTLKANMLKGDLKALMAFLKIASLAGIINVPEDQDNDQAALNADEEAMIAQLVADFTQVETGRGGFH